MKIVCIGRNYIDHIKELGNTKPTKPLVFVKSDNAWLNNKTEMYLPDLSDNIHYEAEIVIKINKPGKHIRPEFAHKYFSEISIGLDLTARDIQQECKENGLPWELAKSWDFSAPVGRFIPKDNFDLENLSFSLEKNESIVQQGNSKDMIHSIHNFISFVSKYMTLKKGDLIFTGTPAGVGKVSIGDKYKGFIEGEELLNLEIK